MFDLYINGRLSPDDDLFFLRKYKNYDSKSIDKSIKFKYVNRKLSFLAKYIPKELLVNSTNDFYQMIRIMIWVNKNLIPGTNVYPPEPLNCETILDKTFQQKIHSNCWMNAVALNEILLSLGYKSRMIRCMPIDLRFDDCHCVVQTYSQVYDKWIMLDPSFGTYYTDVNKIPINLKEFREIIINEERVLLPFVISRRREAVLTYWYKNLFRFETNSNSEFNIESSNRDQTIISLLPMGFDLSNKEFVENNRKIKYIFTHNDIQFWEG